MTYSCPMHPQVIQSGPGNCPICGMALEPVTLTSDEEPSSELSDMSRRFKVSLFLTLPLVAFALFPLIPFLFLGRLLQGCLAAPVVFWGGWPFFQRAIASLKNNVILHAKLL